MVKQSELLGLLQAMMGGGVKKDGGFLKKQNSNWKNSLIAKVKDFQKASETNKQAWYTFCDSRDVGKYDPQFYEPKDLQTFLDGAQVLSLFAGLVKPSAGGGGAKGKLVEQVKQFQKSSEENKQAWYAFCATQPVGKYDPSLHEPDALKMFLGSVGASGGFTASSSFSAGKAPLVAAVKSYQKASAENKQAWHSYCDSTGIGKYDPVYYEPDALQTFLESVGSPVAATASLSTEMGALIVKVKQFQKSSAENKQAWWSYCDSQAGGGSGRKNYDPALHDPTTLQIFLDSVGIPY